MFKVCTERGFGRLPGGITGQTPHQLPSQPENCSRRRSGCRLLHRMLRSLRSLRWAPSTPEKWTFQLWLDTRIDITAPLGDDGSDTTAHSCSVVASAATSTVHHYVATSVGRRVRGVQLFLSLIISLYPVKFGGLEPTVSAFGDALGSGPLLALLRDSAAAQLPWLPTPVGFLARHNPAKSQKFQFQHSTGLDPPAQAA